MALGYKHIETRSWRTSYRGELAIHAAKGWPAAARSFGSEERAMGRFAGVLIPRGAVLCVVELLDCVPTELIAPYISALERRYGDYTPGRWAWPTRRVEVLPEPVEARGALGLWEWTR